jgi:hypothetical protein
MQLKWIAAAALAVTLVPGVVLAQGKTSKDSTSKDTTASGRKATSQTTTTTSTGDVSASTNVTPDMLKAQSDPNIIGSPAWWRTHATADGKPAGAARKPSE